MNSLGVKGLDAVRLVRDLMFGKRKSGQWKCCAMKVDLVIDNLVWCGGNEVGWLSDHVVERRTSMSLGEFPLATSEPQHHSPVWSDRPYGHSHFSSSSNQNRSPRHATLSRPRWTLGRGCPVRCSRPPPRRPRGNAWTPSCRPSSGPAARGLGRAAVEVRRDWRGRRCAHRGIRSDSACHNLGETADLSVRATAFFAGLGNDYSRPALEIDLPSTGSGYGMRCAFAAWIAGKVLHSFNPFTPKVINFKFLLQPHQQYCITQYEELGFS